MKKWKLPVFYDELHWTERKEVREQYIKEQKGHCMWCACPLNQEPPLAIMETDIDLSLFPETMFKYPIHLQHDRETGLTEGAVHARCNAIMWQYYGR